MVFLPSYKIKKVGNYWRFEEEDVLANNKIENESTVWLVDINNNYEETTISISSEGNISFAKDIGSSYSPIALMNIGKTGNGANNPLIMGINSGDSKTAKDHLLGRGLTITEYGLDSPKLFLGDLSKLGNNYSGYGLYSDNVYLNGSLITKSTTGKVAGVNTISGITGELSIVGNTSPIIFWAGADNNTEFSIKNSLF
jgi:hypothetical protein